MTGPRSSLSGRAVVVGGAGAVGGMFASLLARGGAEVVVVDRAPSAAQGGDLGYARLRADVTAPNAELAELVADAAFVVLAVPEDVAVTGISAIGGMLRADSLVVDTVSVKRRVVAALQCLPPSVEAVSVNPMFAPSLAAAGRPMAAVVVRGGARGRALLDHLAGCGAELVEMTAERHDRTCAVTQALTHAAVLSVAVAVRRLGLPLADVAAIAPPPHATMLALAARIVAAAPETYWDVQAANPYAAAARAALADSLGELSSMVSRDDSAGFVDLVDGIAELLGPYLDGYRASAARIFDSLGRPSGSRCER